MKKEKTIHLQSREEVKLSDLTEREKMIYDRGVRDGDASSAGWLAALLILASALVILCML